MYKPLAVALVAALALSAGACARNKANPEAQSAPPAPSASTYPSQPAPSAAPPADSSMNTPPQASSGSVPPASSADTVSNDSAPRAPRADRN